MYSCTAGGTGTVPVGETDFTSGITQCSQSVRANSLMHCVLRLYLESQLLFVFVLAAKHFSKCSLTKFGEG